MSSNSSPNLPNDLKVTVERFSMVIPMEKTERRCKYLSNIDQALNFHIKELYFFQANLDYPPEKAAEMIENAFRRLLVPYDFLAGRLKFDAAKGRFEVDCNSAGAGFAVASSELTVADLGSLVEPNRAFQQLTQELHSSEDNPIFVLQVTRFQCGGFAMSISSNHILMDGTGFGMFLMNLASLAAGKPLAIVPNNDRTLLAARSPPRVTFSHPELLEITDETAKLFETSLENVDFKVFHLSEDDIRKLKMKAKLDMDEEDEGNTLNVTSFNVVMAHVWRCKALSGMSERTTPDQISTMLYAVDVRSRLGLPPSYVGNAVITAYGKAKIEEMKERPFSYLVKICMEGTNRITDEYVRSVIDWGEVHKGFLYGDVLVSSRWKLGFEGVEYPWGRPLYSCPILHHMKDVILLFSAMDGVYVLVGLASSRMKIFQQLFIEFLLIHAARY